MNRFRSIRTIDVVQFVREDEIGPIHFERSYYGAPDDRAVEPPASVSRLWPAPSDWGRERSPAGEREHLSTFAAEGGCLGPGDDEWPDEIGVPAFEEPRVSVEATTAEESAS